MLVIQNETHSAHTPYWKFILGKETYEVKDVAKRVYEIENRLKADKTFKFIPSEVFPDEYISSSHPYFDFIKETSTSIEDSNTEYYPDLFPGEGANLPGSMNPLWAGIYCTDCVTPINRNTYNAAKGSADIAMTGAQFLLDNKITEIYALCRPPGHHAGPRIFGGYCYFNNVVLAANILAEKGTVAILDIDYHHGNGTQEFLANRKDVLTCSIHADPTFEYPYYWGYREQKSEKNKVMSNYNIPLPMHSGNNEYIKALEEAISVIKDFNPAYFIIAAGFDTHIEDKIGTFNLTTDFYGLVGQKLAEMNMPTLICQEGGYNTSVLGDTVYSFLKGFVKKR